MSRTKNSLRNIKFSVLFQALKIIITFFTRKVFVLVLTQEYLGLDGTFSNILSMLSLAELGVGSAITFSLYKPLAEGDRAQIRALMGLFRRAYWTIGGVVALLGCGAAPFLPVLIKDLPEIPHIYLIYLLFVADTALSYLTGYKQTLLIADQQQYVTTTCHSVLNILLHLAQALLLWLTRNYFVYLGLQLAAMLLENGILFRWTDRLYPFLRSGGREPVKAETRREIMRNTRAMVFHKIGGIVVFGTDNLLISYFVGVVAVGLYSNYVMITGALSSIYSQLFSALSGSVGNLGATEEPRQVLTVFRRLNFAGNWLYGFSSVCLVILLNPFIELWLGREYLFQQSIVCLIALNFYVGGMRSAVITFRDAEGLYWYDRYKPIAESLVNLVASIALAVPYGVAGILGGTFVSTMTTCFWIEPAVLFRYGLEASVRPYFKDYAVNTVITLLTAAVVWGVCEALPGAGVSLFLAKMAVCAVVGNAGYLLAYHRREEFRYFTGLVLALCRSAANRIRR